MLAELSVFEFVCVWVGVCLHYCHSVDWYVTINKEDSRNSSKQWNHSWTSFCDSCWCWRKKRFISNLMVTCSKAIVEVCSKTRPMRQKLRKSDRFIAILSVMFFFVYFNKFCFSTGITCGLLFVWFDINSLYTLYTLLLYNPPKKQCVYILYMCIYVYMRVCIYIYMFIYRCI